MPIAMLHCPVCVEFRGKTTREFDRSERPQPTDFEAIPPQPPILTDDPPKCVGCNNTLIWRFASPQSALTATGERNGVSRGHPSSLPAAGAVTTLFAAEDGEDILEAKALRSDCYVFITTKRAVAVDLAALLMDKEMR